MRSQTLNVREGGPSQGDLLMDWIWGVRQGSGMTLGLLAWATGRLDGATTH